MALVFLLFSQGRDKVPAYWLGAFFNPRRFLSIIKQVQKKNASQIKALKSGSKPFPIVLFVFSYSVCMSPFSLLVFGTLTKSYDPVRDYRSLNDRE